MSYVLIQGLDCGVDLFLFLKIFFLFNLFMRNARFYYIIYFIFAVMDYLLKEENNKISQNYLKVIRRKIVIIGYITCHIYITFSE